MRKFLILISSIILIVSLLFLLVLLQKRKDERFFKKYEFPDSIEIVNNTDYDRADTLLLVLIDKVLKEDSITIYLEYIPNHLSDKDFEYEYYGLAVEIPFGNNNFQIFLKKDLSLTQIKRILSHEIVHVEQYKNNTLQILLDSKYLWKGYIHSFKDVKYEDRPFEKEAFKKEKLYYKELEKYLYD